MKHGDEMAHMQDELNQMHGKCESLRHANELLRARINEWLSQ